ncbi:MAG: hypothetical protein R2729_11735 [Bryobacteraceae bacterium]
MPLPAPERHTFRVSLDCRYLLQIPNPLPARPVLALALHGYGMNAASMLSLAARMMPSSVVLASLEAPNQFFLQLQNPGESPTGYNWGTREHWQSAVAQHHEMVLTVLGDCRARFAVPASRCLLIGFSQPVGLNYRFAATNPDAIGGVIGVCGGVPRDWEEPGRYRPVTAPLLHIARDHDEYYPVDVAAKFADRLRTRARDVEFHMLEGAHRFPSQAGRVVLPWMERIFGASPSR